MSSSFAPNVGVDHEKYQVCIVMWSTFVVSVVTSSMKGSSS